MSSVLIVAEQQDGCLKSSVAELITVATQLGSELHAIVLGKGSRQAAEELAAFGVASAAVLDGDIPIYSSDAFTAAALAHVLTGNFTHIVLMHSMSGRDLGARLAAKLRGGWINDVTRLEDGGNVFIKPLYAGKVLGRFSFEGSGVRVLTIRPKNFSPAEKSAGGSLTITELPVPELYKSKVTALQAKAEGTIDLKDADIIVSGGRAVGGPEGFEPLRSLARSIGAALGASRATVDAGWIDHSHQVGQTGKVVNPKLYIACGISGAIQHLAGMQTSHCIVAINSNESAPIFRTADYGIVGDIFEIVPELEKQLTAAINS
jgi:electron transfer flavoprotein alpha subunit